MIIGKSGDTYLIHNNNRYNTYSFSYDDILSFVISNGYTSFLLTPYYSNGGYWIMMCNPTLDNGGLYLLDYEPNADLNNGGFYSTESTSYKNRWVVASSSSALSVYNSMSVTLGTESYQNRTYTRASEYISDMHGLEYVFGTSLNYSKVYVNNIDITPVSYTWESVPNITGKNGILSLVTLDSESINDGEPVSGAAVSVFDQAPSNDNNIKDLADTYGSGEASSAVDVTVKYKVTLPPGGPFSVLKLVTKKDSEPEDVTDGDKIVNISANKTKKTVTGLDENSTYYFKIFAEDSNGSTSESNEKHITTSADEGWSFDYTGEIQTFVAPKTGIYQLETWGAQGGDASDGMLTARGGYGAYAYGEVLLTQGEKLYINVGGQNGYGGGGNYTPPNNE